MADKIVITLKENDKGEWEFSIKTTNTEIKKEGFFNIRDALKEAEKLSKKLKEYKEELKNQMELF